MTWIRIQLLGRCQLNERSKIQNRHTIGNMLDHRQVMGNEKIGQSHLFLQIHKKIDDLCLNRNIKRGDRLIENDELRLHGKRTRDTDSLALSAGKLVHETVRMLAVQSDQLQIFVDHLLALFFILRQMMNIDSLSDDVGNGHTRVKRSIRILKNHLHLLFEGKPLFSV